MKINYSRYKLVPEIHKNAFLQFRESHPYKQIEVHGQTREYIDCGSGERTLVFLHGALVTPDMWFYPILRLESQYRIIAPYFPAKLMGLSESIAFLKRIYEVEDIDKAVIIGMSYGGGIAQYFADAHPEMIDTLVLSHTGIAGDEKGEQNFDNFKRKVRIAPTFLIRKIIRNRIEDQESSKWNEFHRAYFMDTSDWITKQLFLDYLASMERFIDELGDFSSEQRTWAGKTIIFGTRDDKDAFEHLDRLNNLYPQAISHIFEEPGGHHMLFLFPEVYTEALIRMLE